MSALAFWQGVCAALAREEDIYAEQNACTAAMAESEGDAIAAMMARSEEERFREMAAQLRAWAKGGAR